jgi:DNA-binding transcriptional LysR family regulator
MHIETLKTFCDLVETRSFGKAAQLNFISQSAVSQQLKALEARYSRRLLERGQRDGVALTEAGRLFYAECREIVDRFRAVETQLRESATAPSGTIRIATVYSIGLHTLPPYITRFMKAHPRVKVHLEYSRTNAVCEACVSNAIDFGVVAFPLRRANLTVVPWHDEKLVLVCSRGHRLARQRKVSLRQLSGEDFIAFERDIPTRKVIDGVLKAHGIPVNRVMEFDNVETIKRSIEVGSGVSILPSTTIRHESNSGRLAALEFTEGRFTRTIGVVHRRGRVLSAASREFIRMLLGTESLGGPS